MSVSHKYILAIIARPRRRRARAAAPDVDIATRHDAQETVPVLAAGAFRPALAAPAAPEPA